MDGALNNLAIYRASGTAPCTLLTVPYGHYLYFACRAGNGAPYANYYSIGWFGRKTNVTPNVGALTEVSKGSGAATIAIDIDTDNQTLSFKLTDTTHWYVIVAVRVA